MTVPVYLPYYVLAGSIGIIAVYLAGLDRALRNDRWASNKRAAVMWAGSIIILGWFALSVWLTLEGSYSARPDRIPTIQYAIFVPVIVGGVMIGRSAFFARIIDAIPQHWLVGVQLYRTLGAIFLVLFGTRELPGLFAWPAGLGDVLVGVLPPVVAIAYFRDPQANGDLVAAWNWLGLGDLAVAVTAGFLTSPSAFQLFAFELPNQLITEFPLALIPVFLVPVSVLFHLASLKKLHSDTARAKTESSSARAFA
ncbi:MAG: hypothetical protein J2P49_03695 [Methylocapsa sp.]|nr:hypothetical protein [Methylocapsa sp.]